MAKSLPFQVQSYDTLRLGLPSLKEDALPKHPVELIQQESKKQVRMLGSTLLPSDPGVQSRLFMYRQPPPICSQCASMKPTLEKTLAVLARLHLCTAQVQRLPAAPMYAQASLSQTQMLTNLYGSAVPAKMSIETQILDRFQRLPGLHSSKLGLESLTGAHWLSMSAW